ncbi:MAG: septum formation initiator family protein [Alicyclobacillaceae bacterium]|nr:septum formation initiator family protein [Alicyclobacillaceae bacterium]
MALEMRRGNTNVIRLTGRRKRRRWRLPRLKLRYLFFLCVVGWAAYTVIFVQWPKLRSLQAEQERVEAQLRQAEAQNQSLREKVRLLEQDQYVADLARQEFKMAKPGEILFATPNSPVP